MADKGHANPDRIAGGHRDYGRENGEGERKMKRNEERKTVRKTERQTHERSTDL